MTHGSKIAEIKISIVACIYTYIIRPLCVPSMLYNMHLMLLKINILYASELVRVKIKFESKCLHSGCCSSSRRLLLTVTVLIIFEVKSVGHNINIIRQAALLFLLVESWLSILFAPMG